MQRFRSKKASVDRSQSIGAASQKTSSYLEAPALPPASDFRTSLILPELSKRFTLLRTSNGDLISLDDMRSRFAEQRAKGTGNTITEEEENMLLEALSRIRTVNSSNKPVQNQTPAPTSSHAGRATARQSTQSSTSVAESELSSLTSRSSKRHSNNLFGSGQFRDLRIRLASTRSGSSRSVLSSTSDSTTTSSTNYADSMRPTSPDQSTPRASAATSSVDERVQSMQSSFTDSSASISELWFPKPLSNVQKKRISSSLQSVIREIEEDTDDKVLLPRSASTHQLPVDEEIKAPSPVKEGVVPAYAVGTNGNEEQQSGIEGWVVEGAKQGDSRPTSPQRSQGTTSPVPRIPGYIPGMPRPTTPRATDSEDMRSQSTTPRAISPYDRSTTSPIPHARRGSTSSSRTPQPSQRMENGKFTPVEDWSRGSDTPTDTDLPSRVRASSPLSASVYASLHTSSRPTTPSNVTWNVSKPKTKLARNGSLAQHGLEGTSSSESSILQAVALERTKSLNRALRSTDSPLMDGEYSSVDKRTNILAYNSHSPSPIPHFDLDGPVTLNSIVRSPTPSQQSFRSPHTPNILNDPFSLNSRVNSPLTVPSPPFSPSMQALTYTPRSNSSQSSLVSTGSSYHSWEDSNYPMNGMSLFGLADQKPVWHDFSMKGDTNSGSTIGATKTASDHAENTLRQFTGLTKGDIFFIQEKLLEAAQTRPKNNDPRSSRRRRPSNAQSIQSQNGRESRTTSPAPTSSPSTIFARSDNTAKANALLASVVDSIPDPARKTPESPNMTTPKQADYATMPEVHQDHASRRNKDLADVLFGHESLHSTDSTIAPPTSNDHGTDPRPPQTPSYPDTPAPDVPIPLPVSPEPTATPLEKMDPDQLMRVVQEKTQAAMASLRKAPSVSRPTIGSIRRRINPQDISGPRLFQSSTSVDKIPSLPASSIGPPGSSNDQRASVNTLSQRMRKLRDTLRVKNASQIGGDLISPVAENPASPYTTTTTTLQRGGPSPIVRTPTLASLEQNGEPVTTTAPGSSLRSLFRIKRRGPSVTEFDKRVLTPSSTSLLPAQSIPTPPAVGRSGASPVPVVVERKSPSEDSAPVDTPVLSPPPPPTIHPPAAPPTAPVVQEPVSTPPQSDTRASHSSGASTDQALQQLFAAAKYLGLDSTKLHDFVNQNAPQTLERADSVNGDAKGRDSLSKSGHVRDSHEHPRSPVADRQPNRNPDPGIPVIYRHPADSSASLRPVDVPDGGNVIVRRTLVFSSDNTGQNAEITNLFKKMARKSRRVSGGSVLSTKSVRDRVPTPPPPTRGRRFSAEASPPVPRLPNSSGHQSSLSMNTVPETGLEKSNSTYDSLYEMYTGERAASVQGDVADASGPASPTGEGFAIGNGHGHAEAGQAVEVIEYANGETIWSIVNGLRSEDAESVYQPRLSVASEMSMTPQDSDVEPVFFKEHHRNQSKGSNTSFGTSFSTRKKSLRPETKVYYSSSTQIARLIETLSRGAEAGSFNIKPRVRPGHSHSSSVQTTESDVNWTVEERLDHMLGTMGVNI